MVVVIVCYVHLLAKVIPSHYPECHREKLLGTATATEAVGCWDRGLDHLKSDLDLFDFELSDDEMTLGSGCVVCGCHKNHCDVAVLYHGIPVLCMGRYVVTQKSMT